MLRIPGNLNVICPLQTLPATEGMGNLTPRLSRSVAKTTETKSGPDGHSLQQQAPHVRFTFSSSSSHRSGCQNGRLEQVGKSVRLSPPSSSGHCSRNFSDVIDRELRDVTVVDD